MLLLLLAIFLLHLSTIIFLIISTANSAWWSTADYSMDIWKQCFHGNGTCVTVVDKDLDDCLQAVQASMVLAVIFSCCGFFVFICQLFTLKIGNRFIFTGVFQLLSCLCVVIAAVIYTIYFHTKDQDGGYGSSYILGWLCFPLTLISGVIYTILRKRD
ncbi:peripheral myelin protein 22-like [Amblyraja radiata]|uniref:peripheral myelin protein 22-like n=1 Tax=Amblyraja radiata TaxID=386614 RepID=UPI001401FCB0|nr:peripheral myelin protein 22-like [Amblyraja radiata]